MKSQYNNVTIDAATGHETFTITYTPARKAMSISGSYRACTIRRGFAL